jgi:hypothetical protein
MFQDDFWKENMDSLFETLIGNLHYLWIFVLEDSPLIICDRIIRESKYSRQKYQRNTMEALGIINGIL